MSAKGAHFNVEYVKEFYKISDGEILAGQLKQCILKHAQSHNTSEWKEMFHSQNYTPPKGFIP